MKHCYILFLFGLLLPFSIAAQNDSERSKFKMINYTHSGDTDRNNTYYRIEQEVNSRLQEWQQRGTYETSAAYRQRISIENQRLKDEEFTREVLYQYASQVIDFKGIVLDEQYDADTRTALLYVPNTQPVVLTIPPEEAADFYRNWNTYQVKNARFGFYNKQYVVYEADFIVGRTTYPFRAVETAPYGQSVQLTMNTYPETQREENVQTVYSQIVMELHQEIQNWLQRGEFEPTVLYEERITTENRNAKEKEISARLMNEMAAENIDLQQATIQNYNPDAQVFTISIPGSESIFLPVDYTVAPDFKAQWPHKQFVQPRFGLYNNQFVLLEAGILVDDSLYQFEAKEHSTYGATAIRHIALNSIHYEWLDAQTYNAISAVENQQSHVNLIIKDIQFTDTDGNNRLDAGETAYFFITIANEDAVQANVSTISIQEANNVYGLYFVSEKPVPPIAAGSEQKVQISVKASQAVQAGSADFTFRLTDGNTLAFDEKTLKIPTKQFLAPQLSVPDYRFASASGGRLQQGETAILKLIVENTGEGIARDVKINFQNPPGILAVGLSKFYIPALQSGEKRLLDYEFVVGRQFSANQVIIMASISEAEARFGTEQTCEMLLNQPLAVNTTVDMRGTLASRQFNRSALVSDVDIDIPHVENTCPNRFALIIGNEDYATYQNGLSTESNVDFARNDAVVFAEYATKTMGIPEENLTILTDATAANMKFQIEKLAQYAELYGPDTELFFYYSGHGFPDETTKQAYIMPVDVTGANVANGIRLNDLYETLTQYPCRRVTVFLDACFSGGGRNQGLLAAKTVRIKPKENTLPGNLVAFSASSGNELALFYKAQQHGMFTYFLLKKLQETRGNTTYQELYDYLYENVRRKSLDVNDKLQNPEVATGENARNNWQNWKLNE